MPERQRKTTRKWGKYMLDRGEFKTPHTNRCYIAFLYNINSVSNLFPTVHTSDQICVYLYSWVRRGALNVYIKCMKITTILFDDQMQLISACWGGPVICIKCMQQKELQLFKQTNVWCSVIDYVPSLIGDIQQWQLANLAGKQCQISIYGWSNSKVDLK